MKAWRSSVIAIALRRSRLSNGGFSVIQQVGREVERRRLAHNLRHLALHVLQHRHRDLVGEGHVEIAGNEGEDRGRAVRDDRVVDAVEIGSAGLPVIPDSSPPGLTGSA